MGGFRLGNRENGYSGWDEWCTQKYKGEKMRSSKQATLARGSWCWKIKMEGWNVSGQTGESWSQEKGFSLTRVRRQ